MNNKLKNAYKSLYMFLEKQETGCLFSIERHKKKCCTPKSTTLEYSRDLKYLECL